MTKTKSYLRFSLSRRFEHWIMVSAFVILAITGLPQKYIESPISELVLTAFGGIESTRIIHRVCAVILILIGIYHLGTLLYHWFIVRGSLTMLPTKADVTNAWKTFRYNLGFEKQHPKQGFYTFEEKFEYWALIWGTAIMILTGFMLWNPITTVEILPGAWIPVAKAAHGNEALLAVLAVIIWHFYQVLVRRFNTSMFTGYMSQEEMQEDHPLVLEEEAFRPPAKQDPAFKKRRRWFYGLYGIVTVFLLGSVYWFITIENTAVAVPDEIAEIAQIEVYAPLEQGPLPTHIPITGAADIGRSWQDGIGEFFEDRCGVCHRSGGGAAHLDMVTYQGVLVGGDSGSAVVPGYPGISLAVIWNTKGEHPGEFTESEIAAVKVWILAGAPEN